MRILHVLSQHELTGAEVYAATLIDAQVNEGHQVIQISNAFFKKNFAQQNIFNVETKNFFQFIISVLKLRKFLKRENFQVIHTHSRAAAKLVFYARMGLKSGHVSSIHGRQHSSFSKKFLNQYGEFAIPVCNNIARQLVNEFKYNPQRIKSIPNSINQNSFSYSGLRSLFQFNKPLNIVIIGRTTGPKKNRTELFIKNFTQILEQKNIKYTLTLLGGSKIDSNIKYKSMDFIDINSEVLNQYDLVCGSGRAAIESMISGVPCIAFGESEYIGLLTDNNFAYARESNFGDIGLRFSEPTFNLAQAKIDFDLLYSNSINYKKLSELASTLFNEKIVYKKIMRTYESAYFVRNYPKWIPILMYHKIPDEDLESKHKIYVNKNNFEMHLNFFKKRSFTTITFEDLSLFRKGLQPFSKFPKKPLLLTFDDGYEDNLSNADMLLKKYNMKATVYLLADQSVDKNNWDNENYKLVSKLDRKKWLNTNFQIGSHGFCHSRLPSMTELEKNYELIESKKNLESEFLKPIISFAFTYGDTNTECSILAEASGYEYALNTDSGGLTLEENPYSIFRVNIFPNETKFSLWKKTHQFYRKYYYYKRKQ